MNRRKIFKILAMPGLVAAGAGSWMAAARSRNAYYDGPTSDHFDGVRFHLPKSAGGQGVGRAAALAARGRTQVMAAILSQPFRRQAARLVGELRTTLIGHASFLIQVAHRNILIDPVFAERASPFDFTGPRRVNPPGIAFADLPAIHTVLLTHNHYDHLDLASLDRLWRRDRPHFVAPLGNDAIIRARHPDIPVESRDWDERWSSATASPLTCGRPITGRRAA